MIEDHPSLKAHDKGLDLSIMTVATSVEDGIKVLSSEPRFDRLYLDGTLGDGSYIDILTWLSDHLDKVPEEIISISFSTSRMFYPMVQALQEQRKKYIPS
jgi:hypothetical protein